MLVSTERPKFVGMGKEVNLIILEKQYLGKCPDRDYWRDGPVVLCIHAQPTLKNREYDLSSNQLIKFSLKPFGHRHIYEESYWR